MSRRFKNPFHVAVLLFVDTMAILLISAIGIAVSMAVLTWSTQAGTYWPLLILIPAYAALVALGWLTLHTADVLSDMAHEAAIPNRRAVALFNPYGSDTSEKQ